MRSHLQKKNDQMMSKVTASLLITNYEYLTEMNI